MKKKLVALLTLVTFLIMSIQFPVMAQGEVVGNVEPTRKILVKLNNAKRRSMLNHQSNLNLGKKIKDDIYQVEVNSEALEELLENEEIEYIEEDSIVVKAGDITTWNIEKIQAPKIKEEGYTGKGIKVAVFDTGIDLNNTDLKVAGGASFVDGVSSYNDDNGHGTAMAGVLCWLILRLPIIKKTRILTYQFSLNHRRSLRQKNLEMMEL